MIKIILSIFIITAAIITVRAQQSKPVFPTDTCGGKIVERLSYYYPERNLLHDTIPFSDTPRATAPKVKDSVQYVPLYEKRDTLRVTIGTITNGILKFINGYVVRKGFAFQNGNWASQQLDIVMFLDESKKVFKGRIVQAIDYDYDMNPLRVIEKRGSIKIQGGVK